MAADEHPENGTTDQPSVSVRDVLFAQGDPDTVVQAGAVHGDVHVSAASTEETTPAD
ncbi:hypothetical protein [Halostreptopolyspora alba]|uniref:hypothetical protein n=1 Tax=Halostreptopolyspora alba TaxID=2487137 RepID=UPI00267BD93B